MAGLSSRTVQTEKELFLRVVCNYIDIQSGLDLVYVKVRWIPWCVMTSEQPSPWHEATFSHILEIPNVLELSGFLGPLSSVAGWSFTWINNFTRCGNHKFSSHSDNIFFLQNQISVSGCINFCFYFEEIFGCHKQKKNKIIQLFLWWVLIHFPVVLNAKILLVY